MDPKVLKEYANYFNKQKGRPYPCSNQIVVCAIITKDRDKALSIMEENGAVIKRQSHDHIEWELNNERWLWKNWNMNYRGYRFYKVLVDDNINDELFLFATIRGGSYCCYMEII